MGGMAIPVLAEAGVRRLRQRAQLLEPRGSDGVAGTVRALAAVQAQVPQSAALCVRARTSGLDAAAVEAVRVGQRAIVRAWTVRGTLHLVPSEDLGWLLSLYDPVLRSGTARRYRELRLTDEDLRTGVHVIRDALAQHGPQARRDLAEHLATGGIDPSGQRLIHLINRAALEGVLCHGPDRTGDGDPSYVLCTDWLGAGWVGPPREREAARAELALRYVRAYGPAAPRDFATWSGLPMADTRGAWRAITDRLVEVSVAGEPAWIAREHAADLADTAGDALGGTARDGAPDAPVVRLLASFDTYLLGGYRSRELTVPAAHAGAVWTGGGWIKPTLTVDGYAAATWSTERRRGQLQVVVHPFDVFDQGVRAGLDAEVADTGRFLGVPTGTIVAGTRTPQGRTARTASEHSAGRNGG